MQADECGSTFAGIDDVPRDRPWTDIVRPIADKFTLPAKVGCEVRLDAEAARCVGQTVELLGSLLELRSIERNGLRDTIAAQQSLINALCREQRAMRRLAVELAIIAGGLALLWIVA